MEQKQQKEVVCFESKKNFFYIKENNSDVFIEKKRVNNEEEIIINKIKSVCDQMEIWEKNFLPWFNKTFFLDTSIYFHYVDVNFFFLIS